MPIQRPLLIWPNGVEAMTVDDVGAEAAILNCNGIQRLQKGMYPVPSYS
jgi:hypothetical protein